MDMILAGVIILIGICTSGFYTTIAMLKKILDIVEKKQHKEE